MAGGKGERFWPASRTHRPKQFLALTGDGETMLQKTVKRLDGLVEPDNIYIVTNAEYFGLVQEQLPTVPAENLLCEPAPRNTDPTPLWFTESTTPMSFVWQYYNFPGGAITMCQYGLPGPPEEEHKLADYMASSVAYVYSFEESEGYDTDGDFKPDNREVVSPF